jgi:rod shape determining protein RodA
LRIGGFSFQPVQVCVAAGIVLTASLLQDLPRLGRLFEAPFAKMAIVGILTGIPFLIVVKMGDMGSAIVWLPVALVTMIVAGMPYRHLLLLGLCGMIVLPIAYFGVLPVASPRGAERIELYLDMVQEREVDITGVAYAPYYVSMAVGKAGWSGIGWNASAERGSLHAKRFIPWETAHNDFIFAVIAEEQGFRGSLLLITAFALLLIQCLFVAFYSRDVSGRVLVAGVVALFFAHIFENIGMCVLLMPITGIPLPLISYSGTFVLITMFLLGLVQSVWIHRKIDRDGGKPERGFDD